MRETSTPLLALATWYGPLIARLVDVQVYLFIVYSDMTGKRAGEKGEGKEGKRCLIGVAKGEKEMRRTGRGGYTKSVGEKETVDPTLAGQERASRSVSRLPLVVLAVLGQVKGLVEEHLNLLGVLLL